MKKILTLFLTFVLIVIIVPTTNNVASASTLSSCEIRYTTPQVVQNRSSEVIYYTNRTVLEQNTTQNNCPYYQNTIYDNACGAVAGADVIGFYDKYYEDLIPDYKVYLSNGNYKPTGSTAIPSLISELYTLMRINVDDVGCTQSEFLNGLSQYVSGKNRSITYTNAFSNGSINYSTVKSAIDSNNLLIIFCNPTQITTISAGTGADTLSPTTFTSAHIMIVYGYYKVQYRLTNGSIRTDTYLRVTSGITSPANAYYCINTTSDVIDLKQVSIY